MKKTSTYLNQILTVEIDRQLGSKHPKYDSSIYPINYGYLPNTISGDGKPLDCYILGVFEPVKTFTGKCIAIIQRTNDDDDKLIIVPEGKTYTNEQIDALVKFQEQYFNHIIIRPEDYLEFNTTLPEFSVTNLAKSLEFYQTIGFKINYERKENKFAFISLGKIQFMLQEITNNDKWNVGTLAYPFGNGINFQLDVTNLNSIYNSLKSHNYPIQFDIEENWYRQGDKLLGSKEFLVQDPDGYLLRISEDLGIKNIQQ